MPNVLASFAEIANEFGMREAHLRTLHRGGVLPRGVVLEHGRRLSVNRERFAEWVASGGSRWPGKWRKRNDPA
jgi:hypothetical protein